MKIYEPPKFEQGQYSRVKIDGYVTPFGYLVILSAIIGFASFLLWFFPMYGVWMNQLNVKNASLQGEAELSQANYNRQVAIASAKAKFEAAKYEKQTIVIKAKAYGEAELAKANSVAKANKIISNSLDTKILQNNYIKALPEIKGNLFFTNGNSMPAVVLK